MSATNSAITETTVKEGLLGDKGRDAILTSWAIKNFTSTGENFATVVTSVLVNYSLNGKEEEVSYIVKLSPDRLKFLKDLIEKLYIKEVKFYKDLAHLLSAELTAIGKPPLRIPKYIYSSLEKGSEVLFISDLRPQGFQLHDRYKSLDVAHSKLVLKELARLHAASLLLQRKKQQDLAEEHDFLKVDWITFSENAPNIARNLFEGPMMICKGLLEGVGGYEKAVDWLTKNKLRVYDIFEDQLSRSKTFDVICHGDCWKNNVLFRYNEDGVPVEAMLLDLQVCRKASVGTELSFLMYTSFDGDIRRDNIQDFLAYYHNALSDVMKAGGASVPFTLQDLQEEYKRRLLFGFFFGMLSAPMLLMKGHEVPSFEGEDQLFNEKFREKCLGTMLKSPLLQPRILALFDDMIAEGVIV